MNGQFSGEPRGFVRSRPIRVAFLLSEGEHEQAILDAIFSESVARWGGRYSLVCPCENGFPRERYLSWLRVFDPDIIYSFVDLTNENLRRLREQLGPGYLVRHDRKVGPDPAARDFRVALPLPALTSISVALQYARAFPASAPQPMRIIDYLPGQKNDRFIDDNFGTYYRAYGQWPLPEQLADAIKPLTVASEELLNRPNRGRRFEGETVSDATALLRQMVARRNSYGLAQLAADSAPRVEIRESFDNAFKLVIGDSFADRVYYWNCRSRASAYLGREFVAMIVSPARLDDKEFFAALVEFLKARNGVTRSGGAAMDSARIQQHFRGRAHRLKRSYAGA